MSRTKAISTVQMIKHFEQLTIKKTTVNEVPLASMMNVIISRDMEEYSGWGWVEHVEWIATLCDLSQEMLMRAVDNGYLIWTDESCSYVWLLNKDSINATARLIHAEEDNE